MKKTKPIRRRNADTTRQAILDSARALFAQAGYDGAGVREIAAGAGVTAMMVNRYFGSKEQLFMEAMKYAMSKAIMLTPEVLASSHLGADLAAAVVGASNKGQATVDGFSMVLRSLSNETVVDIARRLFEQDRERGLARVLEGPLREERAAIMLALVTGFYIMRQTTGVPTLVNAEPEQLVALLTRVFDVLGKPGGIE